MAASDTKTPAKKTKKRTRRTGKTPEVIEEPVTIRVQRTVKAKANQEPQTVKPTGDQENPGDPKDENADVDLDTIEVRRFLVEPARVNYHYSVKRSCHFQGVDVGCSVTIPCYVEEIEDALEEAKRLVAARLKIENKKTGAVLDFLIDQRIKKDQDLSSRGIR